MQWSWQLADWPEFQYLPSALAAQETAFLKTGGVVIGTTRHLVEDERQDLIIELISTEALKTSEIEGVLLDRASVQSSLRRQFGLQTDSRRDAVRLASNADARSYGSAEGRRIS